MEEKEEEIGAGPSLALRHCVRLRKTFKLSPLLWEQEYSGDEAFFWHCYRFFIYTSDAIVCVRRAYALQADQAAISHS